MPQDMPPVGGYQAVQYKRNLPARGFRPGTMLIGMGLVMGYGWYQLTKGIREAKYTDAALLNGRQQAWIPEARNDEHTPREEWSNQTGHVVSRRTVLTRHSELAREKMWARIHLIPLLQAEEDRDQVRRWYADQAREKELLGENTKVYHNERVYGDLEEDS
ncbi:GRIM-19 protein [Colletotrichum lupini]|uniref:NADH dehydrogenase [ubiquinone] 1 alpha subcomplex subunit 13 n=1 Tax=Colletotrichum lupini TaxID=145971 RepID=A0A9Q8WGA5_9PEZI|nr:GRIM-19 protein [Colletotrichum lupini]UQC81545.1 GRIM-19 protein [Colletotrichum lupini]